ncbi:MAG: class I SAM-dependent methyltransferase [Proteobacteria bacterium]|nr:class I SAM-dependent methyltransferase [Pseudomonadota bacterium]
MHTPEIIKLHVDERCEYRLRREMPWIFAKHADFGKATPKAGDLVAIYGKRNQCIKLGLYDAASPIPVRILGNPCTFDETYIQSRLAAAITARTRMGIASPDTNGLRMLSGESEGLPGLVIDAFADTWVLKVYSTCWLPYLDEVIAAAATYGTGDDPVGTETLNQAHISRPSRIVLRFGRECLPHYQKAGFTEGSLVFGTDLTPYAEFLECGAKFHAQVFKGQKTGFFLDQRNNRQLIRSLADGKKVLDICCYSGGFSLNAAIGGASAVWSLDGDKHALDLVQKHYDLNSDQPGVAAAEHILQKSDMFDWLERAKAKRNRFDLIIADPPSFASSQAQIPAAEKAYMRLFAAAADCLVPKGQILCCSCSSHIGSEKFADLVSRALKHRTLDAIDYTGLPEDHVAKFAEARYLKAWLLTIK